MTKYSELINKIIWFVIPVLIGFFTWITVMLYSLNTDVKVTQQEARDRGQLQEKIYQRLDQKLDVSIYEIKHKELLDKVSVVQAKVDKIYKREISNQKYFSSEPLKPDTSFLVVKKNLTDANTEKRGGIKE